MHRNLNEHQDCCTSARVCSVWCLHSWNPLYAESAIAWLRTAPMPCDPWAALAQHCLCIDRLYIRCAVDVNSLDMVQHPFVCAGSHQRPRRQCRISSMPAQRTSLPNGLMQPLSCKSCRPCGLTPSPLAGAQKPLKHCESLCCHQTLSNRTVLTLARPAVCSNIRLLLDMWPARRLVLPLQP